MIPDHRKQAKVVAVLNLVVLSIGVFIALVIWIFLALWSVQNISDYISSHEGIFAFWILAAVAAVLEGGTDITLLFGLKENNFTKVKVWFLANILFLGAFTMAFLVEVQTLPSAATLVPICLAISIKSVSLWILSKTVDEMKADGQLARLIPAVAPSDSQGVRRQCYAAIVTE